MNRKSLVLAALAGAVFCFATDSQGRSKSELASGGIVLGLSSVGSARCVDGTATGSFPPCTPGTHVTLWRNFAGRVVFVGVAGEAAEYVTGVWQVRGSCNLDENLSGPCWGAFQGTALDGMWEGTWNGNLDFAVFGGYLNFVGHGSGGSLDGLHLKLEAASTGAGSEIAPMPFTVRVFQLP
jgi:hypothetical protein